MGNKQSWDSYLKTGDKKIGSKFGKSKKVVKNKKQVLAIALGVSGLSKKKKS